MEESSSLEFSSSPLKDGPIEEKLLGVANPWSIKNLDEFMFYCCPQCDHQTKSQITFLNHAFLIHPEVKSQALSVLQ